MAGLLAAAGVLTYGNSLGGAFVYDDRVAILSNPYIRHLWPLSEAMGASSNSPVAGRPLISLSLAVNYALGGFAVRGYHAFNIAVHILGSLVLFGILRRTLLGDSLRERFGGAADGVAAACALLWLVHPIQTEAVDYLTQRTESVMGLLYLLTLYTAIRASSSDRQAWWSVASVLACALGMASKESMVTAPLMVACYDWAFRSDAFARVLRRRWALYTGLAATWGVLWALMRTGPRSVTVGFSTGVSALTYAMNQCVMIVQYLRLALWPRFLVLDYGTPQPLTVSEVAPYAAALAILVAAAAVTFIRRPALGFAGAWFLVTLAPTSSVVPIASEVGAERRMYLPLAGLIALAVTGGYLLLERVRRRPGEWTSVNLVARGLNVRAGATLVMIVAVALGWASARRNAEYRSEEAIWRTVLERRPQWRAHHSLGLALEEQGRYVEAISQYREALRGNPGTLETHYNLAHVLELGGDLSDSLVHYREFLRLKPGDAVVENLVGVVLAKQGRTDEAIAQYRRVLRMQPDFADAHAALGDALLKQQQFDEAADHYRQVLAQRPDEAAVHNNLGMALVSLEKPDEAIAHLRRAIELAPDNAGTHFNLGLALSVAGQVEEGQRHFREAVRLNPDERAAVDDVMRDVRGPAGRSAASKP